MPVLPTALRSAADRQGVGRWAAEARKQLLGFADSSARTEAAVLRVAPFVGFLYTALVVWFLEGASQSQLATPPLRPFYKHKRGLCFADILRAGNTSQRSGPIRPGGGSSAGR